MTKWLIIFLLFASAAHAGIVDELCGGNADCQVCLDSGKFARCEDKPIFDKDMVISENPLVTGGTNSSLSKPICPKNRIACVNRQETVTVTAEDVFEGFLPDITSSKGSQTWLTNLGTVIGIVQKESFYIDYSTKLSGEYISSELEFFSYLNSNGTPVPPTYECRVNLLPSSVIPNNTSCMIEKRWINSPVPYKLTVKVAVPHVKNNWVCAANPANPCVEDGGSYVCSPNPCGKVQEDAGDLSTDDQTPKDDGTKDENGVCTANTYIFPGAVNKCRAEGLHGIKPDCCKKVSSPTFKDKLLKAADTFFMVVDIWNPILMSLYHEVFKIAIDVLLSTCSEEEIRLSLLKGSYGDTGNCVMAGEYCSEYVGASGSFLGTPFDHSSCVRNTEVYCCFDSVIAKNFNIAARKQLSIGWGTVIWKGKRSQYIPPQPNCRGLTYLEMMKLNLNSPEFSQDMRMYFQQVLLPELLGPNGALDANKLISTQQNLIKDIENFYK